MNSSSANHSWPRNLDIFVHPHWFGFSRPPEGWYVGVGILCMLIGGVGTLVNVSVLIAFFRIDNKSRNCYYTANLAFADLMIILTNNPLKAGATFIGRWTFGQPACGFYGAAGGLFGIASICTMALISFDRCSAVRNPLHSAGQSSRGTIVGLLLVWTYSVILIIPPFFGWNRYQLEGMLTACSFDYLSRDASSRSFVLLLLSGAFILPMAVILASYGDILNQLRKRRWQFPTYSKDDQLQRTIRLAEIRATKNAALIVFFFCTAWMPYTVILMIAQFSDASIVTPVAATLPALFAKTAAMYNPLVYAISLPKFAEKLRFWHQKRKSSHETTGRSDHDSVHTRSVNLHLLAKSDETQHH